MAYSTIALVTFICVLIGDIVVRINSFIGISNGSTELVVAVNIVSVVGLLILGFKFRWKDRLPKNSLLVFKLFMAWSLISFIRGVLNAQDYWDWKILLLNYSFLILVPLAIVVGINYEINVKLFRFILGKLFLFGLLAIPFTIGDGHDSEFFPRVVMPVSFFILLSPYLQIKWRALIFAVAMLSISMDFGYRTNLLRIIFSMVLVAIYFRKYIRYFVNIKVLNFVTGVLFCLPLMFLYLGVNGQFNPFADNPFDYNVTSGKSKQLETENLATDTRTFLYLEVFHSMVDRDSSFIIGEGGGSAYETTTFADSALNERGRYGSEVGFLNTLLYSGMLGVLLYALMLFAAAYYAINRSNNYLCKMLGLFLAFHWVLFFIEDITKLDMNFYFIWLAVGLCLSNKFRTLTDVEVKQFFSLKSTQVINNVQLAYRSSRLAGLSQKEKRTS